MINLVAQVNKAFIPTYDQKLYLSALFNQAKHGPFTPEKAPEVGMFDFVGKERRYAFICISLSVEPNGKPLALCLKLKPKKPLFKDFFNFAHSSLLI